MRIRYIYHSGFLVETQKCSYIFDYYKGELPKLDPIKPAVVFVSHGHGDHYNPEVFSLLKEQGVKSVLGILGNDISKRKYPGDVEIIAAKANKTYTLPNGEKLETLLSTDKGVAFLLTTEEGVVYHAGDLNLWVWDGESEEYNRHMLGNFRAAVDKLKGRHIDIAMLPLDPRQEKHYADGMAYFLKTADVGEVYPMHYWEQPGVISDFAEEYPMYADIVKNTEEYK